MDTLTWGIDLDVAYTPTDVVFSPDARTVFARSWHPRGFSQFQVIDTGTGVTQAAYSGMTFSLAAAFAPLAPALGAAVAGTRLDLTWSRPMHSPDATRFVLEAGTAPGLTDVGTLALGPGQTLSIPGVPPGSYVVRVRAANATGVGVASNEVVVTVPQRLTAAAVSAAVDYHRPSARVFGADALEAFASQAEGLQPERRNPKSADRSGRRANRIVTGVLEPQVDVLGAHGCALQHRSAQPVHQRADVAGVERPEQVRARQRSA